MRVLNTEELICCYGGAISTGDMNVETGSIISNGGFLNGEFADGLRGMAIGATMGFAVGGMIGYKWGGGGGWIAGAIAQAVGYVWSGFFGALVGAAAGALYGTDTLLYYAWTYAENGLAGNKG